MDKNVQILKTVSTNKFILDWIVPQHPTNWQNFSHGFDLEEQRRWLSDNSAKRCYWTEHLIFYFHFCKIPMLTLWQAVMSLLWQGAVAVVLFGEARNAAVNYQVIQWSSWHSDHTATLHAPLNWLKGTFENAPYFMQTVQNSFISCFVHSLRQDYNFLVR